MKTLVIGAEGIAGTALMQALPDALGTTRRAISSDPIRIMGSIDITYTEDLLRAFYWATPEAVVNCAGIVKSECDKHSQYQVGMVNGRGPHTIAQIAKAFKCRVIHLSTDCVFDGTRGGRTENDLPDATDLYGRTKSNGEIKTDPHCVTLRTSFIGRDRTYKRGLLEWLFTQKNETIGFTRAMWSGLSAPELARVVKKVLNARGLSGLYHVSGPVISKADLLEVLIKAFNLPCRVRREDEPRIDRTLNGLKFLQAIGYTPPTWSDMAKELAES